MTLVELLVVIAIIGLLASIALTQFALYKQKANDAKMQSSLHGARQAMEGFYASTVPGTYVGATETALHDDHGYRASDGVTLSIVTATQYAYSLRTCAVGGSTPAFFYDSAVGVMAADPGTCP